MTFGGKGITTAYHYVFTRRILDPQGRQEVREQMEFLRDNRPYQNLYLSPVDVLDLIDALDRVLSTADGSKDAA